MHNLSRREREKQQRRDEILQAAWEVFSYRDYDSATIDDVAAAAEVSKGTVYLYFCDKADLFFATFEMGIERVFSLVQEVISSNDDPVAGLEEIIRRLLDFFKDNMGFFKILFSERAHFEIHAEMKDTSRLERLMDIATDGFRAIADYIQHGIEIGVFRQVDPGDVAFLLVEIIRGFAFAALHPVAKFKPSGKAENIASILLDGIREKG